MSDDSVYDAKRRMKQFDPRSYPYHPIGRTYDPDHIFAKGVTIVEGSDAYETIVRDKTTGRQIAGVDTYGINFTFESDSTTIEFKIDVDNALCEVALHPDTIMFHVVRQMGITPKERDARLEAYALDLEIRLATALAAIAAGEPYGSGNASDELAIIRADRVMHGLIDGDLA